MFSLKGKRNKVLILLVVVLLFAGGVTAWLVYRGNNQVSSDEFEAFMSQTQELQNKNEFKKIEISIKEYLQQHKSLKPEYKYELTYFLAGNYVNLKDFKAALATFLDAEKVSPTGLNYLTALGIAQMAQATGDNNLAIEYYKKTIELAKNSDNSVHSTFIPQYEKTIKILENPNDVSLRVGDAPAGYPIDGNFPAAPR